MQKTGNDARRALLIRTEQIKALYAQLAVTPGVVVLVALLLVAVMWERVSPATLVPWLIAACLDQVVRTILYLRHRRNPVSPEAAPRWARWLTISSGLSGCIWGSAGIIMFLPGAPEYQAALTMILYGIATGSIAVNTVYLPVFYAYALPTLTPIIIRTAAEGDSLHIIIAILLFVFMPILMVFGRDLNLLIVRSLRIRYENIELIDELTAQKAAAEHATQLAETANRAKSQFLAAASHDLRQPLHALGLFVAALDARIRYPEARSIMANINASVAALEALFNELLDISKLDAGVIVPQRTGFALQRLFDRLAADFAPMAADKGLRFKIVRCGAMVHSDPTLLERILRNLIANSIRYTATGGVVVGLRLGDPVCIQVCDTGIGIQPGEQERIFEEFYQIGNPERDRTKGLGLGLAIVKRLAVLLGYAIRVSSVPGRGSVFSVELPAGDINRHRQRSPLVVEEIASGLDGCFVILIDDERAVREGMRALLTQWGCETLVAGSLDEALQEMLPRQCRPDLIIADYRLREGATGSDAIGALQAEYGTDIPGVLITGDTAPDRIREAKASGYQVLHKPVPPAKLRALMADLIQQHRKAFH